MKRKRERVVVIDDEEAAEVQHSNEFVAKCVISAAVGAVLALLAIIWFLRAAHIPEVIR